MHAQGCIRASALHTCTLRQALGEALNRKLFPHSPAHLSAPCVVVRVQFDPRLWAESAARHGHWDMAKVFRQFDSDHSGFLSAGELKRAFRAIGLPKRSGAKLELDEQMFRSMDTDGNGKLDVRALLHAAYYALLACSLHT